MNTKQEIIDSIRKQPIEKIDMPDLSSLHFPIEDKETTFISSCEFVGGKVVSLNEQSLDSIIKKLYPEAKSIVTNLSIEGMNTIHPDEFDTPHQLANTDVAIIEGTFGVAENGAVWIPKNTKHRALYFIAENLIILLDRNKLVSNMHDAYDEISDLEYEFGVFISGPSKTADIEQALVIGAHGAKEVTIVLR
ncbi:LUD domain-containing protein [Parabacteroides sp. PF5-9]|uniref:LutC/YkgG family protein n=1 Tax=Parabacteroides sp. PF5-9 TaxID=1742404 RepID=UPI002473BBB7|nr:LUD domain-containing protein [Parabacteroides sp. PF5-9]MDH6356533.1 L-lactate dehydrogenase complex protein LldG [Parabacteroides sp. PF5-9]